MSVVPSILLSSGYSMPVVGMGVWRAEKGKLPGLVKEAIRIGYRHFDCAGEKWRMIPALFPSPSELASRGTDESQPE